MTGHGVTSGGDRSHSDVSSGDVRHQSLFVLASLASGERHGYGIAQDAEELSEGRVRLTAGTLYGALNRLTDEGLVAESREDVVDGRRRRYYRLTAAGETALAEETERLRAMAAALSARARRTTRPAPA